MVTLGHIIYLNCIPVHGAILSGKINCPFNIITGTPYELNTLLESGIVDISPCSSVEILKGHAILPDFSISSRKDVQSIILFTKKPLEEIKSGTILITNHSATSSLLLKLIMAEFFSVSLSYEIFEPTSLSSKSILPKEVMGILHIGDIALKYFLNNVFPNNFLYRYDLASLWYEKTEGLPFTFALWQLSNKSFHKDINSVTKALNESYNYFLSAPEEIATFFSHQFELSEKTMMSYWNHLNFNLEQKHIESLELFFKLCKKIRLIEKEPEFRFIY